MEDTDPLTLGTEREIDEAADDSVDGLLRELAAAPPVDPSSAPEPGELIGRSFRIERMLGEGGMGVVYLAHDEELDRPVALKLQRSDRSSRMVQRLAREARAMARVSHPNVVPVHEVGEHRGRVFIAMEYVDGGTARDWVATSARTWEHIVDLYVQAGRGLAAAHAIGLVHRDFKPDNVLVGRDGRARVADFGLARPASAGPGAVSMSHESAEAPTSTTSSRSSDRLRDRVTMTGAAVGTAQYMAPEQHGSGNVDARADQFSFCVALYEALAQRRPFSGSTPAKLLHNIHLGRFRPPRDDRRLPPHVLAVLRRGLSADPNDRFPSMDALLAKLTRKPMSRWKIAAGVWAVGIAGIGGAFVLSDEEVDPCEAGSRRLGDAWTDDARSEIQTAVDRVDKDYATAAWSRAIEPMTAYATAWGAAYREACEATHLRHEQPIAMLHKRAACLDQRRIAFVRVIDMLRELDEASALRIHDTVRGLPRLEPCADLVALERSEDLPEDAAAREAVARLEEERVRVRALDPATQGEEMLAQFERMLAEAEAIGYRPLSGRLRVNLAEALYQLGRTDDDGLPRQAFHDALASGDDELALLAVSLLVRFHAGRKSPEAYTWAETGRALLSTIEDPVAGLQLMRAEAIAYSVAHEDEKAIEKFQALIDMLLEHAPEHHHLRMAYADLGKAYGRADQLADAERYLRRALDQTVADLGPDHPDAAEYAADLGRLRAAAGDFEGARILLEGAIEVLAAAKSQDNGRVAIAKFELADVYMSLDKPREALALLGPAVETLRDAVGEERHLRIDAETSYAQILADQGRVPEARAIFERLIAEQPEDKSDPTELAYTLIGFSDLQEREGDCEAAMATSRKVIELVERHNQDAYRSSGYQRVADCAMKLGRRAEAIENYERAIEAVQRAGRPLIALARARIGLAKALRSDPGQTERVATLRRLALEFLDTRTDPESLRLAEEAHSL
jgi:tetratricopeptide (TPR) repeat protein/predicted Ser/Thr protein kinase